MAATSCAGLKICYWTSQKGGSCERLLRVAQGKLEKRKAQAQSQGCKEARASGGAVFAALHEVGAWYKAKHHEIEEAIHMAKVASDFSVDPGQAVDLMQTLSQMVMALDLDDDDE